MKTRELTFSEQNYIDEKSVLDKETTCNGCPHDKWHKDRFGCDCEQKGQVGRFCVLRYLKHTYGLLSRIPMQYYNTRYLTPELTGKKSFDRLKALQNNIDKFVENGDNLFIVSESRACGKTSWACRLGLNYITRCCWPKKEHQLVYYIDCNQFITFMNLTMYKDPIKTEMLDAVENADLVIWDNLGEDIKSCSIGKMLLSAYVSKRVMYKKSNIFCMKKNDLKETVSPDMGELFNKSEHIFINPANITDEDVF